MERPEFIIIGDPDESKGRFSAYREVLEQKGIEHLALDAAELIGNEFDIPPHAGRAVIRAFSPWYSQQMKEYFHSIGTANTDLDLPPDNDFFISHPKTTSGFATYLENLEAAVAEAIEKPVWVNPPEDLYVGRNKIEQSRRLQAAGISYPRTHPAQTVDDVYELHDALGEENKLFVKIHSGSVGRGIGYLHRGAFHTTVRKRDGLFKHAKRVEELRDDSLARETIQFLLKMESIVQEGIPLDTVEGSPYDIRYYVKGGSAPWTVLRKGDQDVTNADLGARTYGGDAVFRFVSKERVERGREVALAAAKPFSSNDLGIDIGFDSHTNQPYCFEVNFLPGIGHVGVSIYEAEVDMLTEAVSR